jgi:hypothetical protein
MMDAIRSSETSVFTRDTQCTVQEDGILQVFSLCFRNNINVKKLMH